ncbi:MAG TPA: hypothetical protein EYN73_04550 [Chromatiaceae bacterium]|jgi:uncharacterized protein YceK|nr:hypothetical protein [Chromatiaceae bacterium]HIN81640.1 hypothetical protein [Chromatiales bacterium]HIA08339.1 hypothetical protein [Chromatiaceae bacterium]HIB83945.1 hypothetical protein [Chromatiaceae bacterium]HIO14606.1 hypothetical protein [Chromatiales bacterium]
MRIAPQLSRICLLVGLLAVLLGLNGCSSMIKSATGSLADSLSHAVLNQNDPETVRQGAPTFLILLDGLIDADPDNQSLLVAGAKLYGAYASAFVTDEARRVRLAGKSKAFASRALCASHPAICGDIDGPYEDYIVHLKSFPKKDVKLLYEFSAAWAGWIQANSNDWNAIIDLPKVEAGMLKVVELNETYDAGSAYVYLGVMATQLPPAFGGKPEVGRKYFERANELAGGKNLMTKVLFAKNYARLVFDRDLHDQLLNEVLEADPVATDLTLINSLAKQQAQILLDGSDDYF